MIWVHLVAGLAPLPGLEEKITLCLKAIGGFHLETSNPFSAGINGYVLLVIP